MRVQRNPRDDLLLALHAEIVRSTHELYELRDLCETNEHGEFRQHEAQAPHCENG